MSSVTGEFSTTINKCIGQKERDLRGFRKYRLAENLEEGKCCNTYELIFSQEVLYFSMYYLFIPFSGF